MDNFQLFRKKSFNIVFFIQFQEDQSDRIENSKNIRECFLSYSRTYHRLFMEGDEISVTQYFMRPSEFDETAESVQKEHHKYLFKVPDSDDYVVSTTT